MNMAQRQSWQCPQVERERSARTRAVHVARAARSAGVGQVEVASVIGRSSRTLRCWSARERDGEPLARPKGRPAVRSSREQREALLASVRELGVHVGIDVYQALHLKMARREVASMIHRCREVHRRRKPKVMYHLQWSRPGRVWAVDHSHIPGACKQERIVISSRDLASHKQLRWERSRETAQVTVEQLRLDFERHGAPLVLKTDGGPAFRSEEFKQLLDRYGVELLPSPPYYPQYNGSCEAANRSKNRCQHIADSNGRPRAWSSWDLELARLQANQTSRPWGLHGCNPQQRWASRAPISHTERASFRASCAQLREVVVQEKELSAEQTKNEFVARAVQRDAVSRALVGHDLLVVRRRAIRPLIQTIRSAAIS